MFAGIVNRSKTSGPEESVDTDAWKQALYPRTAPDAFGFNSKDGALLVEGQFRNAAKSTNTNNNLPLSSGDQTVSFWGRLDNRTDLANQLNVDIDESDPLSNHRLILMGWKKWGKALPENLVGDFAFAVIDSEKQELFLARDPMGVKPLYYWAHDKGIIFATTPAAFHVLKHLSPTPDEDWIAKYLFGISSSFETTAYKEIRKVPPGHHLLLDQSGEIKIHKWHEWKDDAPFATKRDPKWVESYREILEESIKCRIPDQFPIGTENSGGIDSATITAYLSKLLGGTPGDRLRAFSLCRTDEEPGYILETSQRSRIEHNYIRTSGGNFEKDFDDHKRKALAVLGYPVEHGNATSYVPFYEECELHGVNTLFSGYGGDEVVTNPGRMLRLELLDKKEFGALWDLKLIPNPFRRALSLAKSAVVGRPSPEFPPYAEDSFSKRWALQILKPGIAEEIGLFDTMRDRAKFDAPYRRTNDWILKGLLKMTYVPTRLENCTLMAASYGIEYQWALWDPRLMQQYLSTPSIEKFGPENMGRYLHRRAISGTVPKRVAWKRAKDMGTNVQAETSSEKFSEHFIQNVRQNEADMNPIISGMIDREKWNAQIDQAKGGKTSMLFDRTFRKTASAISWLNIWLNEH